MDWFVELLLLKYNFSSLIKNSLWEISTASHAGGKHSHLPWSTSWPRLMNEVLKG